MICYADSERVGRRVVAGRRLRGGGVLQTLIMKSPAARL